MYRLVILTVLLSGCSYTSIPPDARVPYHCLKEWSGMCLASGRPPGECGCHPVSQDMDRE